MRYFREKEHSRLLANKVLALLAKKYPRLEAEAIDASAIRVEKGYGTQQQWMYSIYHRAIDTISIATSMEEAVDGFAAICAARKLTQRGIVGEKKKMFAGIFDATLARKSFIQNFLTNEPATRRNSGPLVVLSDNLGPEVAGDQTSLARKAP